MLWQACASFQAVPTAWLGSRGHEAALVVRWQHGIALRQRCLFGLQALANGVRQHGEGSMGACAAPTCSRPDTGG